MQECYVETMKVAIISDVHSNLEALKACCRKADAVGVEQYACLGDMVGYGADPVATMDLLMELPGFVAVRGNHDEAVLSGKFSGSNQAIQQVISWTHNQLSPHHLAFINALPYARTLHGATLVHASIQKPNAWEYLYHIVQVRNNIQAAKQQLTFTGHTHLPIMYYETASGGVKRVQPKEGRAIAIFQQRRYLINVGSVGQPRDGNSTAGFVVYDTLARDVTFYRVAYDYTATARKILAAGLEPYFAQRLAGRDTEQ